MVSSAIIWKSCLLRTRVRSIRTRDSDERGLSRSPERRQVALAAIRRLAPFGTVLLERLRGHLGIRAAKDVRMIDGIDANHAARNDIATSPATPIVILGSRQCGNTRAEDRAVARAIFVFNISPTSFCSHRNGAVRRHRVGVGDSRQ